SGLQYGPPAPEGGCASTGRRTVGLGLLALAGAALARRRRLTA
ncbi:MAG: MYXO-CTERM domain-containing protein, partial [Myxococcota bacterium]